MAGTPDEPRDHDRRPVTPMTTTRRTFKATKATKEQRKLRLALVSYEGQGKTVTGLRLAKRLGELTGGGRTLLVDTEGASSRIYAEHFDFDFIDLGDHSPEAYVDVIKYAGEQKYAVLIIDSLSHEYIGHGGIQEVVDVEKRKGGFGWDVATVKHRAVMSAIIGSDLHVIATMRQKKAWVKEVDQRGKERLRQQGTEPVQREGTEFEFDLIGTIEDAVLTVTKARDISGTIKAGQTYDRPGDELAELLYKIVSAGAPRTEKSAEDTAGIPELAAAPEGEPIGEPMKRVIQEGMQVIDPARRDEARKAIAALINADGYPTWDAFLTRGKATGQKLIALLQTYDRAKANGNGLAPADAAQPAATAEPAKA